MRNFTTSESVKDNITDTQTPETMTTYFIIETGRTLVNNNNKFYSVIIEEEGGAMGAPSYDIERAVATSMTLAEAREMAKGWAYVVSEKKASKVELHTTL